MATEETTIDEVVRRISEGRFYDDYDWASGPALRALRRAREDAQRWRAFDSSARFKMIGSANFDHSAYPKVTVRPEVHPGDWLHFGLEVWDRHPVKEGEAGWEQSVHGRNLLDTYVAHRVALGFGDEKCVD